MQFNEGQQFFGVNGSDRRAKGRDDETHNFEHRAAFYTSIMEGHAPPSAAISAPQRFIIRDKAKTLNPRQRESLGRLVAALDQDEKYLVHLLTNERVLEIVRRIPNEPSAANLRN